MNYQKSTAKQSVHVFRDRVLMKVKISTSSLPIDKKLAFLLGHPYRMFKGKRTRGQREHGMPNFTYYAQYYVSNYRGRGILTVCI